jgi:hypothetical protein
MNDKDKPNAIDTRDQLVRLAQAETGGLDEYDRPEVGGQPDEYEEDGGYDDDGEDGGYLDEDGGYLDEEGGIADDDDEAGGFTGAESIDDFIEVGGKKKKKRRRFLGIPIGKKKKKKKRRAPQESLEARCARIGYGTLELANHNQPMAAGLPYVSVSSGLRIIETPIPLENRIKPSFLRYGLNTTALRTSHTPVNATLSPGAGAFTLNVNGAAGQLNEVIGLALDIGPQPLNTQAGAIMSVSISGRYVDGDAANLGSFKFGLPSTVAQMRIVFFFYAVQNGAPRPKMMFCANGYTTPYQAAVDPVTTDIVVSGTVPAGLFLSATLLGPSQPTYENLLAALQGMGCC